MNKFIAACIQINSGDLIQKNMAIAKELVHRACDAGANIIFLPEHTPYFPNPNDSSWIRQGLIKRRTILELFSLIAEERKVWINFGMDEPSCHRGKMLNKSYLINEHGEIVGEYIKKHLFNFEMGNETHNESRIYSAGRRIVVTKVPWGKLGLSICYDLRFPLLYRKMRKRGADFFSISSAFTKFTGKDHWHTLLKARAIENCCFIFAANQCGKHHSSWQTYGHSLIVSPWGRILAEADERPGFIVASINTTDIKKVRAKLPSSAFD